MSHAGNGRTAPPSLCEETPTATPTAPPSTAPSSAASGSARRDAGRGKPRDPFLDNAKYLTILLVGLGHAWAPMVSDSDTAGALYLATYTFHMPAFIVISGYLSRGFAGRPAQVRRLVTGVAVPYVVFEIAFTLFMRVIENPDRAFSMFTPSYALWFLVALFVWRLTTPVWKALRWPLPVALVIAMVASATPGIGGAMDLMRVLQFLPFFVLGLQLRPEHFELLRHRAMRVAAVPVLAASLVFGYWALPRMNSTWLLRHDAAPEMGVPAWVGPVMTLATFGCALAMTAALLALTPRRTTWFTSLGAGTVFAYLLHVYPIHLARQYDWYSLPGADSTLGRAVFTVLALAMMTALCTQPVRRVFRCVVEPRMEWAFRCLDATDSGRSEQAPAVRRLAAR
ncbi:acyltransferase family protein [Streptomyces sp. JJ66]|uniref:acyltransferase family protein n=1 Tax=Streptomyces sp. JJ66 TaxID=2803843 RepID=UPI001C560BD2|nr:acyltransferase family protein [Streptomyces sp. JJ66]MBW1601100.1 acyltransferase family protein [Streptomyces sp. JJ66]